MRKKRLRGGPAHAFAPSGSEIVEVLDAEARPFMLMPRPSVMAQKLFHRVVLVLVRNREGLIYLHRRASAKKNYGGLWSVSASGFVKAGEALEDAALRELDEELGISGLPLSPAATAAPCPATDYAQISLFIAPPSNIMVNPNPEEISEGMFVDEDELAALLRDLPEAVAPALKWAAGAVNLFNF